MNSFLTRHGRRYEIEQGIAQLYLDHRKYIFRVPWKRAGLVLTIILLLAVPVSKDPISNLTLRLAKAQETVNQLRTALQIESDVEVAAVAKHPLVFSVEPVAKKKDQYVLLMEVGFLLRLNDDELRAALAHELGHVWIYTHHPFLQTEELANTIGQRVVQRKNFEELYTKLWAYEGTTGVPMDDLLGPRQNSEVLHPPVWP
jgi:hypothetical protein